MASTTKRQFTDEFKRESVARGRLQRKSEESSLVVASPAADTPVSTMASPADQDSEIARLRCELERARMERDMLNTGRGLARLCAAKTGHGMEVVGGS